MSFRRLSESSLKLKVIDGVASLQGERLGNSLPWLPYLDNESIHSIELRGWNSECLHRLPKNIVEIVIHDYNDLSRVADWLHAQDLPSRDLSLVYDGPYAEDVPSFEKPLTKAISHFVLPLRQNLQLLISNNHHIKTLGFDFDSQTDRSVLERGDVDFVLWSSHPHALEMAKDMYPQHSHQLYRL